MIQFIKNLFTSKNKVLSTLSNVEEIKKLIDNTQKDIVKLKAELLAKETTLVQLEAYRDILNA